MFCPECGFESEDAAICPDCEVELEMEEEAPPAELEFVALVEATEVDFFAWATARLEEAGIPWFVQSEPSVGRLPRDGGEAGPADGLKVAVVYVAESRVEKARALMTDGIAVGV